MVIRSTAIFLKRIPKLSGTCPSDWETLRIENRGPEGFRGDRMGSILPHLGDALARADAYDGGARQQTIELNNQRTSAVSQMNMISNVSETMNATPTAARPHRWRQMIARIGILAVLAAPGLASAAVIETGPEFITSGDFN